MILNQDQKHNQDLKTAEVPLFSIVIPARNEEKYLTPCLQALQASAKNAEVSYEIIVAINRCSDATEEIASAHGCKLAYDSSKNLAKIRNAGSALARGEILITVDADSCVSRNMLSRIKKVMASGNHIGGGVMIIPERISLGILFTWTCLIPIAVYYRIFAGLFFCSLKDFKAIGGFNEEMYSVEDIDFARRLKLHGKKKGKKFAKLLTVYIITSCRKFDKFGDWYFIKNFRTSLKLLKGKDQEEANKYWYRLEH